MNTFILALALFGIALLVQLLVWRVRVPAAWLIEQCGWKGKTLGRAGVHARQALVLVNHGGATGSEILALAAAIQASVRERFAIDLVPEVEIL